MSTLISHIQEKKQAIQQECDDVHSKEQEIVELEQDLKACHLRTHIRKRHDLENKIKELRREILTLKSRNELKNYEEQIKPFLQEQERYRDLYRMEEYLDKSVESPWYSAKKQTALDTKASKPQNTILEDYMAALENQPLPVTPATEDICEYCCEPLVLEAQQAILACPLCGASKFYMDATSNAVAYGEEIEMCSYSYQRSNHFSEWLTYFQAKESTQVPVPVLEQIMGYLCETGFKDPKLITLHKIREVTRKLKLKEYYKQVTQIWSRITGNPPPRLSQQIEIRCKLMFRMIQAPFEQCTPSKRANFLSYSYCLYHFMRMLGCTEYLKFFPLLKGTAKLKSLDEILEKICNILHWTFVPSPVPDDN